MYAKAHLFGYQKIINRGSLNLLKSYHRGEPLSRVQTIVCYKRAVLNDKGEPIMVGRGKDKHPMYENVTPYVRTIKHYDKKPTRGRTFAEMVYESVRV